MGRLGVVSVISLSKKVEYSNCIRGSDVIMIHFGGFLHTVSEMRKASNPKFGRISYIVLLL